MRWRKWLLALGAIPLLNLAFFPCISAQQTKKPFTVADEIGLTLLVGPNGVPSEVYFSPDGNYFAVWAERGLLSSNQVEDSLRFYSSTEIVKFLDRRDEVEPAPVWLVNRLDRKGPIIRDWRWLPDSTGVAFLESRADSDVQRLVLADLRKRTIEPLTTETEAVVTFDISDRQHYVYTVADRTARGKLQAERHAPANVGTGRPLFELLLPDDPTTIHFSSQPSTHLWAVVAGERFEVKANGAPLIPSGGLALSPDGQSVVAKLEVPDPPESWGTLYPPSFTSSPYRIRPEKPAHQYVRVNLKTGSTQPLTEAPVGEDAGWWAASGAPPSWSSDEKAILLPGTFLKGKGKPSGPCVAVVDLSARTQTCVEALKGLTETGAPEEGYHRIESARFAGGDKQRVTVIISFLEDSSSRGTSEYQHGADSAWEFIGQSLGHRETGCEGLEVMVEQRFDKPPLLIGANKHSSRVIWDPNPELKNRDLALATVYKWKNKDGRELKGGLFRPSRYKPGHRYPLVIQTHGFAEFDFRPSGVFPTAYAAEALAGAGIVVLQVQENCNDVTPSEGPCAASGYAAAANQLVSEGIVDPDRIGVIGFSRTCFYVMETLTTSLLRLRAASITDGVTESYLPYLLIDGLANDSDLTIGARPFGEGLQQWLKRSPGFNLDKVNTPLLVVSTKGPRGLLLMWEPYAGLRYLLKPVDLIMLNTDEHVLSNPAVRMASQGGSVDWFRFWLQGYERTEPITEAGETKESLEAQYKRWRGLKQLQAENEVKEKAAKDKAATVN